MRNVKKCVLISLFLVVLDQIIKKVVVSQLSLHESVEIIHNFFYLTYVQNKGAAFSILQGKSIFLILFALIVVGYLLYYIGKSHNQTKAELLSYSLIIGGAIGNVIDRSCFGYVIDYLEFHFASYTFPIFNLADTFVVCGTCLLLILLVRGK